MKKDNRGVKIPAIPLIADSPGNSVGYRDTLDRVAAVLQLLSEINLSEGLSSGAETGHYWVQLMLIDSVKYVSDALDKTTNDNKRS